MTAKARLDLESVPQCNPGMNSIATLSAQQLRRAASIKDQLDTLNVELSRLLGNSDGRTAPARSRTMSAAARKKIAAAQKARWAKAKAAGRKSL